VTNRSFDMLQHSKTEDRLTIPVTLVRHLIDTQFPQWANLPIRRVEVDGWDNSTFRLGKSFKVRLPTASRYVAQVEKEHRWLPVLAKSLSFSVPEPVALGIPTAEYPYPWSVYRWIDGDPVSVARIGDLTVLAEDVARFLLELKSIPAHEGPLAGVHSFFRGGPLRTYDSETRQCLELLWGEIDADAALGVWEEALASQWTDSAVWVHGDIAVGNLLMVEGRLGAVIDFGSCAVGDPACDLVIAWTLFKGRSRVAFRSIVGWDDGCWKRARGWALWKALLTMCTKRNTDRLVYEQARQVIGEIMIG
jgi:aminoglycoside phosphotransferase (APT) family kinase protein